MSIGPLVVLAAILRENLAVSRSSVYAAQGLKKKVYNDVGSVEPETDGRFWAPLMATYRCEPPPSIGRR